MSTTFYELWNQVLGEVGADLPVPRAKQIVQDAWRTVLNKRPWSFLLREGIIIAPAAFTGDLQVTQYSNIAVPNASLKTVLDSLASPPLLTRRSLRAVSSSGTVSSTAPIYDIYAYDPSGAGTITLNRDYQEATNIHLSIIIFRRWFLPPYDPATQFETTDFLRWLCVKDSDNDWWLDLSKAKGYLDMIDPNRTSTGTPFMLVQGPAALTTYPGVSFDGNLQPGTPLYELYPHYLGSTQKTYQCVYQAYGKDLSDDFGDVNSVLPPYINPELVSTYARMRAYRWAEINKGRIPSLQRTNWFALTSEAEKTFLQIYMEARRIDDEVYNQDWLRKLARPYGQYPFPFGADYVQTHSWGGWWGGF